MLGGTAATGYAYAAPKDEAPVVAAPKPAPAPAPMPAPAVVEPPAPMVIPVHEDGMARLRGTVALILQKHFGTGVEVPS